MRRIVVIASGMAGVRAATSLKRRMPEHEVNVIVPSTLGTPGTDKTAEQNGGPLHRRLAEMLPNLELLATRDVGVLEASDIMPDLEEHAVQVTSGRGKLPVRYTDLLVDIPAQVRLPRPLQNAANVFAWPQHGFFDPAPGDAALAGAAASGGIVAVVGGGIDALEAVFIAREAGARVHWLRTAEKETLTLDPHLTALALKALGPDVAVTRVPKGCDAGRLAFTLDEAGERLATIGAPGEEPIPVACCLWTTPLMGRHPMLRENGVVLDSLGRVTTTSEAPRDLFLMGSGVEVTGAVLGNSGVVVPGYPAAENAFASAYSAVDAISGKKPISLYVASLPQGVLGVGCACGAGMCFHRAGLSLAEAADLGREAVSVSVGLRMEEGAVLALGMIADRASRKILGVQVLGVKVCRDVADGLFGTALAALAEAIPLAVVMRRAASGRTGRLLASAAALLRHRLDSVIRGITPDEYMASRDAGAEFFTLDLRSQADWKAGHVPGAYSIPLVQLKKRLQDEVPRYTPIVLVSEDGKDAHAVAVRLAGLGATDLYVLDGGMLLWPFAE